MSTATAVSHRELVAETLKAEEDRFSQTLERGMGLFEEVASGGSIAGEDAFQFRHDLIRDAAYQALPKQDRAQLHERLATWLQQMAGERAGEDDEIVGYHLEQAVRYRGELALGHPPDESAGRAVGTAGSAVVCAGITVIIALAGLSGVLLDTQNAVDVRLDVVHAPPAA